MNIMLHVIKCVNPVTISDQLAVQMLLMSLSIEISNSSVFPKGEGK